MKSIVLTLASFACMAVATVSAQNAAPLPNHVINDLHPGDMAPRTEVTMMNVTGKTTTLKEAFTPKGLIVMFSCNTCPFVIKSQARTKEVIRYAAEKGIGMVIINSNEANRKEGDSYKDMQAYAKEQGYNVPYLVDAGSMMADMFGATHTPEVYLFNGEQKLVYHGAMEDKPSDPHSSTKMYLKMAIDNMLAQKPIDPALTKSVGCGIKRS